MRRAVHDVVNGNHAISGVRAMRPIVITFGRFTGVSRGGGPVPATLAVMRVS